MCVTACGSIWQGMLPTSSPVHVQYYAPCRSISLGVPGFPSVDSDHRYMQKLVHKPNTSHMYSYRAVSSCSVQGPEDHMYITVLYPLIQNPLHTIESGTLEKYRRA